MKRNYLWFGILALLAFLAFAACWLVWSPIRSTYRERAIHDAGPPVLFRRDVLICVGMNRPPNFQVGIGWDVKLSIAFLNGNLPSDARACIFAPWNGPGEGELVFPP